MTGSCSAQTSLRAALRVLAGSGCASWGQRGPDRRPARAWTGGRDSHDTHQGRTDAALHHHRIPCRRHRCRRDGSCAGICQRLDLGSGLDDIVTVSIIVNAGGTVIGFIAVIGRHESTGRIASTVGIEDVARTGRNAPPLQEHVAEDRERGR